MKCTSTHSPPVVPVRNPIGGCARNKHERRRFRLRYGAAPLSGKPTRSRVQAGGTSISPSVRQISANFFFPSCLINTRIIFAASEASLWEAERGLWANVIEKNRRQGGMLHEKMYLEGRGI